MAGSMNKTTAPHALGEPTSDWWEIHCMSICWFSQICWQHKIGSIKLQQENMYGTTLDSKSKAALRALTNNGITSVVSWLPADPHNVRQGLVGCDAPYLRHEDGVIPAQASAHTPAIITSIISMMSTMTFNNMFTVTFTEIALATKATTVQ
jgi:hypothetical protein